MLPIFLIDNPDEEQEIASMPGVKRMGINAAVKFLDPLVRIGLKSVLLFAVTEVEKVEECVHSLQVGNHEIFIMTGFHWVCGSEGSITSLIWPKHRNFS